MGFPAEGIMTATIIIGAITITQVWKALGGDPPKRGRARAFWRDGDNRGAVSLSDEKACWHDFVTGDGGGVISLISLVQGCDRGTSLRWLSDLVGLPRNDRPFTQAERRTYARRCAEAEQLARDVADFEHGLGLFLLHRLEHTAAITEFLLNIGAELGDLLLKCRSDLIRLGGADADALVSLYRETPEVARRRFIEDGRLDREQAERLTHAIVRMLAEAELRAPIYPKRAWCA
jgi:hypothetical protein